MIFIVSPTLEDQREIGIQLELIAGTAVYVYEFSRRQAAKLGAKS